MDRIWPAALALLATAGCMPAPSAAAFGPQPAPCTDSITARVARLPTESVTVADREHALWAQAQCRAALDSVGRAALQAPASPGTSSPRTDAAGATAAGGTWPPPACTDSVAARVARMPAESVSVADRQHADAAREQCTLALTAPPLSTNNPASANQTITWLLGAVLVVALWLAL